MKFGFSPPQDYVSKILLIGLNDHQILTFQMHQRDSLDRRTPIGPNSEQGCHRSEEDDTNSMSSFLRSERMARDSMRRHQMELDSLEAAIQEKNARGQELTEEEKA